MNYSRTQLEDLLNRARAGSVAFSPEEIDALAAYLNQTPAAAARLADEIPALGSFAAAELPHPAEWERVWNALDDSLPASPRLTIVHAEELASRERLSMLLGDDDSMARRSRRPWSALSLPGLIAVAACILIAAMFRMPHAQPQESDTLQLAGDVEILNIDARGGATPLLLPLMDGSPLVIWSFDNQGA